MLILAIAYLVRVGFWASLKKMLDLVQKMTARAESLSDMHHLSMVEQEASFYCLPLCCCFIFLCRYQLKKKFWHEVWKVTRLPMWL